MFKKIALIFVAGLMLCLSISNSYAFEINAGVNKLLDDQEFKIGTSNDFNIYYNAGGALLSLSDGTNVFLTVADDGTTAIYSLFGTFAVSPDGTNEVFQVNDGTIDFSNGAAGVAGVMTISAGGDISFNKDFTLSNGNLDVTGNGTFSGSVSASTSVGTPLVNITNGGNIRLLTTTTAHEFSIQAYDVDGTAWIDMIHIVNSNTPTLTGSGTWDLSGLTGLTLPGFGSNNITTSGIIKGRAEYGTDISGDVAHDTAECHGVFYHFTTANVATLDKAADAGYGSQVCYRVRDAAEEAKIDVDDAEKINLAGTAQAAGVAIAATGAGESVCMVATTDSDGSGTDGWEAWGPTSGWAQD